MGIFSKKKIFYGNIFKKSSKITAEEFLKSFRKKIFLQRLRRYFQALIITQIMFEFPLPSHK